MKKSPIVEVVKKVNPAVVSIVVSKEIPISQKQKEVSPFEEYFFTPQALQKEKAQIGGGSGFIFSSDGLILTNRHAVSDPQAEYRIISSDDKKYPVQILARDEINDIAILKIDPPKFFDKKLGRVKSENLPTIELGDSSSLELGQTVIAFGNALGLFKNTVSSGIISGLSRFITAQSGLSGEQEKLRGLIQTDAAINPGNSGGPLCDIEGRVIGINAAMVLGAENISFAIPINAAKKDIRDLKKYGRIRQPFLGIRHLLLNKELQKKFGLPINYGALVIRELPEDIVIIPGSTAEKAGIKEKDIILECNSFKITEEKPLIDIIQDSEIGKEISFKILRNKKEKIIKTILKEK